MTILTPVAVSAAPLLRAIAAGGDMSSVALAEASGRKRNNIARDLGTYEKAGFLQREPALALTDQGVAILAELDGDRGPPAAASENGFAEVRLELIDRDPTLNPRTIFDDEELEALASSIRDKGVAQPILLRQGLEAGRYRIVAGERRFRASQKAERPTIPAMIRQLDDAQALEIATIENIQRVNLSPLEEAKAFKTIIANRMAADPALELKDAKASIAEAVRKTVRYVEQRMDLLELPAILQVRLELDPDAPSHLNLKDARREVQNMRAREREAKAKILTPEDLLVMAEFHDAAERIPAKLPGWWYGDQPPVAVGFRALDKGEPLQKLIERGALILQQGWKGDPRNFVREGYGWSKKEIDRQLPGFLGKDRARALFALRYKVVGEAEAERVRVTWDKLSGLPGEYANWFFNEPFTETPDPGLEEAARHYRQREEEQAAANFDRRAQELAEAERKARQKASIDRDLGPHGRAFLAATRAFEAEAPGLDHEEFTAAFAKLQADFEIAGPYALRLTDDGRDTMIHDGVGEPNVGAGAALEARRRLMVIALNYAAGLAPISGEDLETPWSKEPEPEAKTSIDGLTEDDFVRAVAGILIEDAEEDLAEDRAREMAARGLAVFLDQETIEYGDAEYDWDETGAMALAQGIRVDGLGAELIAAMEPKADDQIDLEELTASEDDEETPAYLSRLAGGGQVEPELEREEG